VKEDVAASVKDNFVRYHLTDDDSEITVIDDFNRVSLYISLILTLTAYTHTRLTTFFPGLPG